MFDMAASQRYPEMSTAWDKMKHLMQADLPKNATVEAGSWCELAHAGATLCDQMWPVDSLYEVLTGATWCRLSKEPWETQWQREMEKDGELGCAMRCDAMRHAGSCPACHPMCGDVAAFGFWDHKTILRHSCDCASSSMLTGCLWWFSDDLCAYIYLLINSLQRGRQTLVPYVTAVLPFQALVSLSRLCKRPRGMEP